MDPYDAIAYPGGAFPQTHPSHLAAIARLFGVMAPDPARARVLEIGCGDGRNLLPMASVLPDATFVGIDPAARPVAVGEALRGEAGLDNARLHAVGVEAIDASWGAFDYIVCHGVWSWVPAAVREAILAVCGRHLAPGGVAYVSYNALPGWFPMLPARDLMRLHAAGFVDPAERIEQARAIVEVMQAASQGASSAYALGVREVAEIVGRSQDGYLFHEYLSGVHEPAYFRDFVAAAARAGLQYLADAELPSMFDHDLPAAAREAVALLGTDLLGREQLFDFLRGRPFRLSLLVGEGTTVTRHWTPDRLQGLWLRSPLRPGPDGRLRLGGRKVAFKGDPPAVLRRLVAASPDAVPASAAVHDVGEAGQVLDLVSRGFVEPRALPPPWASEPAERPTTTALIRAQARRSPHVVTLDHRAAHLSEAQRAIVARADGSVQHPRRAVAALAKGCLWLPASR